MLAPQPSELLSALAAAGLSVILKSEKALKVTPAHELTDELRSTIRASKAQLVNYLLRQEASDAALSDAADPDRFCLSHSPAMSTRELETLLERQSRFTGKGVSFYEAEQLAETLVIRDRESDDQRLCLECAHLKGSCPWRCCNWRVADVAREGLARDLVLQLQRCGGWVIGASTGKFSK